MIPPRVIDLRLGQPTTFGHWIPWDKPEEFRLDTATRITDTNGKMVYENDSVRASASHFTMSGIRTWERAGTVVYAEGAFWIQVTPDEKELLMNFDTLTVI